MGDKNSDRRAKAGQFLGGHPRAQGPLERLWVEVSWPLDLFHQQRK